MCQLARGGGIADGPNNGPKMCGLGWSCLELCGILVC
jgi:hypothetical protein